MNNQNALAETFTLTAFFRELVKYPFSKEIIDFLLLKSWLKNEDLQNRWDWFDKVFWEDYWKKISALSFSTIIEARWLLLDSILRQNVDENTVILEVASWFSPRGLNLINNEWFNSSQYIETDRKEVILLKDEFYNWVKWLSKPILSNYNVITDNIDNIISIILNCKNDNKYLNKLIVLNEWLLIYLTPLQQKVYFENIRKISSELKKYDITLECLHNTEIDFFNNIWVLSDNVNKYYYTDYVIDKCNTEFLTKYNSVEDLNLKIRNFLKQKILYAYSIYF